jgi:predicted TIM-barrel fold metal-dependent hydrolase
MAPTMATVGELAKAYPNVNIVLDHIGFPRPKDLPATQGLTPQHIALAALPNVYYKYTTLMIEQFHQQDVDAKAFLEHVVKTYSADKMVWGSDLGTTPGSMFGWVQYALDSASGLPEAQQKALFFDTAERVFVPGGRGAR